MRRLALLTCLGVGFSVLSCSGSGEKEKPAADVLKVTLRLSRATYDEDETLEGTCVLQNVGGIPLTLLASQIELPGAVPYPTLMFRPKFSESTGIGVQGFGAAFGHRDRGIVPLTESNFVILAPGESWTYPQNVWLSSARGIPTGKHSICAVYSIHKIPLADAYFRTEAVRKLWASVLEIDAASNWAKFEVVAKR